MTARPPASGGPVLSEGSSRRSRVEGFTLVEILVVICIITLLMSLLVVMVVGVEIGRAHV